MNGTDAIVWYQVCVASGTGNGRSSCEEQQTRALNRACALLLQVIHVAGPVPLAAAAVTCLLTELSVCHWLAVTGQLRVDWWQQATAM